jgi:hypothetical protein
VVRVLGFTVIALSWFGAGERRELRVWATFNGNRSTMIVLKNRKAEFVVGSQKIVVRRRGTSDDLMGVSTQVDQMLCDYYSDPWKYLPM